MKTHCTSTMPGIDEVIANFETRTAPDLITMLDDGITVPSYQIEIDNWLLHLTDREASLAPDRLERLLIAMETVSRQRLAATNRADLDDPLSLGGDSYATYAEMYGAPTAIRALIHIRLIVAAAHPQLGPDIIRRAAQHEQLEAERLTAALERALAGAPPRTDTRLN
jgi:hypothetical protein